jgi:hypothetical protein
MGSPTLWKDHEVFTVEARDAVRQRLLAKAREDTRIAAGAEVGSLAVGEGDRWSDLDLTFAVGGGATVAGVLGDWRRDLESQLDAVHLFDLSAGSTVYGVFLLPGLLQVDVSFTPAEDFHPRGPKFVLLFGEAGEPRHTSPPDALELLGLAVHHAQRAYFSIERGRYWQAEHLIAGLRQHTLELACLRLGLPARYGRGLDRLPDEVRDGFSGTLVRTIDEAELKRALARNVEALLLEVEGVGEGAKKLEPSLRSLLA